ncbi:putative fumarase/histidase [Rosa chinensis]|uniref:Putative fumarase/histidase n=1 Tax=Rosa chinensis TaxID=74649 RepID=A0A2P6SDG7_ROSCH|nr:putative fumarase/histidase [Rosa chinensis]
MGSKAHTSMLPKQGFITVENRVSIHEGTTEIQRRIEEIGKMCM